MKTNARLLYESPIFHRLLGETLSAIKDVNGNVIVGTQTSLPTNLTTSKAVSLNTGANIGDNPQDQSATGSPSSVTTSTTSSNTNTGTAPPVTTSQTPTGLKTMQQAEGRRVVVAETWMIPNQESWENPNIETEKLTWDHFKYIEMDLNSEFNTVAKMFDQQLKYGQLARYMIKKFASEAGAPRYNTQANIDELQRFISENKEKIFEIKLEGVRFCVYFHFSTSFDGWAGTMTGLIEYRINGELKNLRLKIKNTKIPKRKDQNDNYGLPFEKEKTAHDKEIQSKNKKEKAGKMPLNS